MKKLSQTLVLFSSVLLISACSSTSSRQSDSNASSMAATPSPTPEMAGAVLVEMKNAKGDSVGNAWIAPAKDDGKGVIVQLDLRGLPEGKHGIHFHEKASCVAPDFKSAGAHFSPTKKDHGTHSKRGPHAGDLGNIDVSSNGTVQTTIESEHMNLGISMKSLQLGAGTSLVIHAKEDDTKTQPSGNSGDRIACGVISALTK